MRRPNFISALFFSLLTVPAPTIAVAAQSSSDVARKEMHSYARCVVNRERRKASEAVLADVSNASFLNDYDMLIIPKCLGRASRITTMSFPADLMLYALADALVNKELDDFNVSDPAILAPLKRSEIEMKADRVDDDGKEFDEETAASIMAAIEADQFLSRYGECVVRTDPQRAKALLMSKPTSSEEEDMFAALGPALASCLPEGEKLGFGEIPLRGTIALNYYRLVKPASLRAGTLRPAE